jgi:hypothetical protein
MNTASAIHWLVSAALVSFGIWSALAAAEKHAPQSLEQARNRMVDEEVIGAGIRSWSRLSDCVWTTSNRRMPDLQITAPSRTDQSSLWRSEATIVVRVSAMSSMFGSAIRA